MAGHREHDVLTLATPLGASEAATKRISHISVTHPRPSFEEVYARWFDFIFRSVRRLGVAEEAVDDVVQKVLIVVHRRLDRFEGRSSVKTWLYGITRNVVREHRRASRRGRATEPLRESTVGAEERGPHERTARAEAARELHAVLDELSDDKREVFVLVELEQLTVPEVATLLDLNLNTVYARLRAARRRFNEVVARRRARDGWRLP